LWYVQVRPGRAIDWPAVTGGGAAHEPRGFGARSRIVDSAYELFSREGVRAIGIDRVVEEAGVAKMTLYRHFPSKDDLVLAFLQERERRWTRAWLEQTIEEFAPSGPERPLALFDALDEWFHRPDYEGCPFVRTLHEVARGPVREETVRQLGLVRKLLETHAAEAGVERAEDFSFKMQALMIGAMVLALRGDLEAARRGREVAGVLLEEALAGAGALGDPTAPAG
jgi:AcrR family transcriptional regulator